LLILSIINLDNNDYRAKMIITVVYFFIAEPDSYIKRIIRYNISYKFNLRCLDFKSANLFCINLHILYFWAYICILHIMIISIFSSKFRSRIFTSKYILLILITHPINSADVIFQFIQFFSDRQMYLKFKKIKRIIIIYLIFILNTYVYFNKRTYM